MRWSGLYVILLRTTILALIVWVVVVTFLAARCGVRQYQLEAAIRDFGKQEQPQAATELGDEYPLDAHALMLYNLRERLVWIYESEAEDWRQVLAGGLPLEDVVVPVPEEAGELVFDIIFVTAEGRRLAESRGLALGLGTQAQQYPQRITDYLKTDDVVAIVTYDIAGFDLLTRGGSIAHELGKLDGDFENSSSTGYSE